MSREIERPAKRQVYAETVMIVGHNPGLEDLVEQLIGERHDLSTAALAQIVCRSISGAISHYRPQGRS